MKTKVALLLSVLFTLVGCRTIVTSFTVTNSLDLLSKNGDSITLGVDTYDGELKLRKKKARLTLEHGDDEKLKFEFKGDFSDLTPGDFSLEIFNGGKSYTFTGEYFYEENYQGREQESRTCVQPRSGFPGKIYIFYDVFHVSEKLDAELSDDDIVYGYLKSDNSYTIRRISGETQCI